MSRITCKCGEVLSNSANPEIEYKVFNDDEWLELMDSEIHNPLVDIKEPKITFWKCTNCERLFIFEGNNDAPLSVYKAESINKGSW